MVGYLNSQSRFAGLTHDGDHDHEDEEERNIVKQAMAKRRELLKQSRAGHLANFQDVMKAQTVSSCVSLKSLFSQILPPQDFHRRRPDVYSPGWRFLVRNREDRIKQEQDWPGTFL